MRRDIRACLRCGSREMHMATIADGLWPAGNETQKWVCGACQWQGAPLLFNDEASWKAYRDAQSGGQGWTRVG